MTFSFETATVVRVHGHSRDWLMFHPGPIDNTPGDWVVFAHWKNPELDPEAEYSWLVLFADFEAMYLRAKAAREGA